MPSCAAPSAATTTMATKPMKTSDDATSPDEATARAMDDARRVAMRPVPPASGAARAAGTTSSGHSHQVPRATIGMTVTTSSATRSVRRRCRYRAARAASVATSWSVSFITVISVNRFPSLRFRET